MRRALLLGPSFILAACALDGVGTRDPDDATGTTGAQSSATTGATAPSSSTGEAAGAGPASSGSGDGGATTSGPGGAGPGGAGGAGPGGAGGGGAGPGGAGGGSTSEGGATSQGGAGGSGVGGQGTGGDGVGGAAGSGGQGGGAGGAAPPECGNGIVELPEECDGPEPECEPNSCTLRGDCSVAQAVTFQPGGLTFGADTEDAPSTTEFGTCAVTDGAPTHLYTYTTGPTDAYVQVIVGDDLLGLADPVLSFHASCFDEALATCLGGSSCCSDAAALQDEALVTDLLPAGSRVTVAVTGFEGDSGHYDITFRDLRYLFLETFAPAPGAFVPDGSGAWSAASGDGCVQGSACMSFRDVGNADTPHTMTSSPFGAPGIGGAVIGWHQRIDEQFFNAFDSYRVQVSIDGGLGWTTVYTHPQTVDETADKQVDASFIAGEEDVRIRFVVEASIGQVGSWIVDDVYAVGW